MGSVLLMLVSGVRFVDVSKWVRVVDPLSFLCCVFVFVYRRTMSSVKCFLRLWIVHSRLTLLVSLLCIYILIIIFIFKYSYNIWGRGWG